MRNRFIPENIPELQIITKIIELKDLIELWALNLELLKEKDGGRVSLELIIELQTSIQQGNHTIIRT